MIKILLVFILMFDFTGQSFQSNLENVPVLKDDTKKLMWLLRLRLGLLMILLVIVFVEEKF